MRVRGPAAVRLSREPTGRRLSKNAAVSAALTGKAFISGGVALKGAYGPAGTSTCVGTIPARCLGGFSAKVIETGCSKPANSSPIQSSKATRSPQGGAFVSCAVQRPCLVLSRYA